MESPTPKVRGSFSRLSSIVGRSSRTSSVEAGQKKSQVEELEVQAAQAEMHIQRLEEALESAESRADAAEDRAAELESLDNGRRGPQ